LSVNSIQLISIMERSFLCLDWRLSSDVSPFHERMQKVVDANKRIENKDQMAYIRCINQLEHHRKRDMSSHES
jgi:hypothetical protein